MRGILRYTFMIVMLVALPSGVGAHAAVSSAHESGEVAQAGRAESLPFKGTLEGRHTSRTPLDSTHVFDQFEAEGQATELGRFQLVIHASVDFGSRPVTGVGTYTFSAANGDRLVAQHTGFSALVQPGTVLITEHAVIDPHSSTGRFAGAEGTFTVQRLADAATGVGGVTVGTVIGTISLPVPTGT